MMRWIVAIAFAGGCGGEVEAPPAADASTQDAPYNICGDAGTLFYIGKGAIECRKTEAPHG